MLNKRERCSDGQRIRKLSRKIGVITGEICQPVRYEVCFKKLESKVQRPWVNQSVVTGKIDLENVKGRIRELQRV